MKRIILQIIFLVFPAIVFAADKKLSIDVVFGSIKSKNGYAETWNFKKSIKIIPTLNQNSIVSTQSVIKNNFPSTLAMLVKPTDIKDDEVTLQFNLLQYGFEMQPTVISQPRIVLKIGQSGEIISDPYKLKVSVSWTKAS